MIHLYSRCKLLPSTCMSLKNPHTLTGTHPVESLYKSFIRSTLLPCHYNSRDRHYQLELKPTPPSYRTFAKHYINSSSAVQQDRRSYHSSIQYLYASNHNLLSTQYRSLSSSSPSPLVIKPASRMSLQKLKSLLQERNLAAYIVPTADAHQSEYVADCDKRREYISGFTGSAGTALIIANGEKADVERESKEDGTSAGTERVLSGKSLLWTDGRYWDQASKELDSSEWVLMKAGLKETPKLEEWCVENLPKGSKVGVDPKTLSVNQYKNLLDTFDDYVTLEAMDENLVDVVWGQERPSVPMNKVFTHPLKYAGEPIDSKVRKLRQQMSDANKNVVALVVTALDELCWLFNLRGSDIDFNPVCFAYALLTPDTLTLYIDQEKLTDEVIKHLEPANVQLKPYKSIFEDLKNQTYCTERRVWLDLAKTNLSVYQAILSDTSSAANATAADRNKSVDAIYQQDSPIALLKAIKNDIEVAGMKNAHIKDGAAECTFLAWLENADVDSMNPKLNEVTLADKLAEYRSKQDDFVGLSFDTIAGVGEHGAIIHYRATAATAKEVSSKELILLDSGGQYRDGTTDITRTFHLGTPSDWQKHTFTLVLKGHIALSNAIFPQTVVGPSLDALARQYLWREGLEYMHGTGHGVGAFLNVHEGPQGISSTMKNPTVMNTTLAPGMIVSNEPGYYESGSFGIRIESLVLVKQVPTPRQVGGKPYLGFETITMVPIHKKMIDISMLTDDEIRWLNDYHADVRAKVEKLVDEQTGKWLIDNTQPLAR